MIRSKNVSKLYQVEFKTESGQYFLKGISESSSFSYENEQTTQRLRRAAAELGSYSTSTIASQIRFLFQLLGVL
jgi:hypothetical protein